MPRSAYHDCIDAVSGAPSKQIDEHEGHIAEQHSGPADDEGGDDGPGETERYPRERERGAAERCKDRADEYEKDERPRQPAPSVALMTPGN